MTDNQKEAKQQDEEYEFIDDAEGQAPEIANQVKRLRERLKQCQEEKQEYLDGWQRAKADVVNARKDAEQRIAAVHQRAGEAVLTDVLEVLDNFDLAFQNLPEVAEEWSTGIDQIRRQLRGVLEAHGVAALDVAVGDTFDPEMHEAVERQESDEDEDTILAVRKRGYRMGENILRPAQVVVAVGNA